MQSNFMLNQGRRASRYGAALCLLIAVAMFAAHLAFTTAQAAQSLMNFTVALSGNTLVEPMAVPSNTVRMTVTTTPDFKGGLSADPVTGRVRITNAHPAGTFTMKATYFGGDGSSSTATFTLTVQTQACNTTPTFNAVSDAATSGMASSIAVGDFNRDGKQDFAAVGWDYVISVRLGNGSGGFSGSTNYDLGELLPEIATGDFNGDGKPDLAVVRYQSSQVSVLNGDGAGGFTSGSSVNVGERPTTIAAADFNGDGKLDIAVTNVLAQTVNVRFGDGLGGFSGATTSTVGNTPSDLKAGDFNGDGKPDLAITCSGTNFVFIRLGDGAGGFTNGPNVTVQAPGALAVGDFNADGKADLAVANTHTGMEGVPKYVAIRLGTATGNFTNAPNINSPLNISPYAIAVADFNGDGTQDLGINHAGFGSNPYTSIQLGNGTGGFTQALNIGLDGSRTPDSIVIGDFNGDGAQDFAVGSRNGSGIQLRLAPQCVPPNTPPTITPSSLAAAKGDQINVVRINIATVSDAETLAGDLTVNVIPGGTATGITIDSMLNNAGDIRAFILVACDATPGSVILQVTDGGGLTATAEYLVFLNSNFPPELGNYAAQSVSVGANVTVTPTAVPFDSGSTPTVTATASAGFTGTVAVNASTGVVTLNNVGPVGNYTITVTATDNCGLQTSRTFGLSVTSLYNFVGFFQPVDHAPTVNTVAAGSSIPVKFSLTGYQGMAIFATGFPASQAIACSSGAPTSPIEETVNAGASNLSYDATTDRYAYVWKTDKVWKGTCRKLVLKFSDGSSREAFFQFK